MIDNFRPAHYSIAWGTGDLYPRTGRDRTVKITIRTIASCVLVAGAAGLIATGARAGLKTTNEVLIGGQLLGGVQATVASGSIGSARASSDGTQYIGCEIDHLLSSSGSVRGLCYAKNAAGLRVECEVVGDSAHWSQMQMIETMRSIGPQSVLTFKYLGAFPGTTSGTCIELSVENGSLFRTASP